MGAESEEGILFDFLLFCLTSWEGRVSAGCKSCKFKSEGPMRRQPSITKWGQGPEDGETTGGPPLISVMARTQYNTTME